MEQGLPHGEAVISSPQLSKSLRSPPQSRRAVCACLPSHRQQFETHLVRTAAACLCVGHRRGMCSVCIFKKVGSMMIQGPRAEKSLALAGSTCCADELVQVWYRTGPASNGRLLQHGCSGWRCSSGCSRRSGRPAPGTHSTEGVRPPGCGNAQKAFGFTG